MKCSVAKIRQRESLDFETRVEAEYSDRTRRIVRETLTEKHGW